jgi:hypothetical protein
MTRWNRLAPIAFQKADPTRLAARRNAIYFESASLWQTSVESQFISTIHLNLFSGSFLKMVEHDLARNKLFT